MNNVIVLLGRGPSQLLESTDGRGWGVGGWVAKVSRVNLGGVVFKIGEIKIASSDNSGGLVVGLSCVEQ